MSSVAHSLNPPEQYSPGHHYMYSKSFSARARFLHEKVQPPLPRGLHPSGYRKVILIRVVYSEYVPNVRDVHLFPLLRLILEELRSMLISSVTGIGERPSPALPWGCWAIWTSE
jgi:hypothetical protein